VKTAAAQNGSPAKAMPTPVKLLSGGNPQIAKADGVAPVQACIAAMPGYVDLREGDTNTRRRWRRG
jgi:hypothetical protein